MTGAELIAAERRRQIESEGWTPEHDDEHIGQELARAAAAYAIPPEHDQRRAADPDAQGRPIPGIWPFCAHWWKPEQDRVRELVKAGALIAAEIDRLARKEEQ